MILHYDPNQQYRHNAINSIINIFEGQPLNQCDFGFSFQYAGQLLNEDAETENILYELLLKSGVSLTAKIERRNGCFLVAENSLHKNDGEIVLILEKINADIIKHALSNKPQKVITLDRLFKNNDQLKTNTALQMKDAGVEFKVV